MMRIKNSEKEKRGKIFTHYIIACIVFFASCISMNAQNLSRTECSCMNNETVEGNGQFMETISIVDTPGKTWRVESATGFFSALSPAPPASPLVIAPGTIITESPAGNYILNGRRVDNSNYRVVLTDGVLRIPLNSVHTCRYPLRNIIGDFGVCVNSINKSYKIDIKNTFLQNILWTVPSGGSIIGSPANNPVTVDWSSVIGTNQIRVSGLAKAYDGQNTIANMCTFRDTAIVSVANETPVALACNDLVTITMNGKCEMNITPDMILENPLLPASSYDIVLRDLQKDTIIPNVRISQSYLNKLIEVSVVQECGGNSCWGLVKFEDKSIPRLVCNPDVTINCNQLTGPQVTGYPLKPDAIVTPVPGTTNKFLVKNFDFCSDVTLSYTDAIQVSDCAGIYSSVIRRTWVAVDISGNVSQCFSDIYILKADTDDITFPKNYDDILGPNNSLPACGTWPKLPNGHPDPAFTGSPQGVFCLNVTVDFVDTRIQKCRGDKTFKLLRKWVVTDICNGTQIIHNQTITVMDKTAPVVTAPANITVGTVGLTCASQIKLPAPTVLDCSGWEYYVAYKIPDVVTGLPTGEEITADIIKGNDGLYTITNAPDGVTKLFIIYYVVDDCDNTSSVTSMVEIKDSTPPVPVCDEFSFVGLNQEGVGFVTVESLDDGSWDNCGIDKIEALRMEGSSCGITNTWGPKMKFCCEDANKEFMVQLRVTDKAGNSNTCMVKVRVQDNQAPTLTNCPADRTVNCGADLFGLAQYGVPTASDLCGATLKEEVKDNGFDECGRGSITRIFTATDNQGNTTRCQQVITVKPTNPFAASDITWPADHDFLSGGCLSNGLKPEDLPANKQRPTFNTKPCSQVVVEYDDIVFQYVEGFCFKVLRKWTIIDWCQFDPTNPTKGRFTYTQVIKGKNTTAPTITKGCNPVDIEVKQIDNCKALIEGTATATDDCTLADKFVWSYTIDADNNNTVDFTGNNNSFSRQVNFGKSKITWTVSDECGNSKTCSTVVEVKDQKKPTPYCLSEIATVIMSQNGAVTIWASDFNAGSYDNCSKDTSLIYSFTTNVSDKSKTFSCTDMTDKVTTFDLRMYVTDISGNSDYCTVKIKVQDNNNICGFGFINGDPDNNNQSKAIVSGSIKLESSLSIDNVNVSLTSDQPEFPKFSMTNEQGEFIFNELEMKNNYNIIPSKNDEFLNGISTLDLVLIQRHILGIKKLDSPYKIIAADANDDHKISASDLVILRKLILGLYDQIPNGKHWKFVDKSQQFSDLNAPFPYNKNIGMEALSHSVSNADFIAVKVGDVNSSFQNARNNINAENRTKNTIAYSNTALKAGQEIAIPFEINDKTALIGLQLAMQFDNSKYEFIGVTSDDVNLNDENVFTENDKINLSFSSTNEIIHSTGNLFKLVFKAKKDVDANEFIKINRASISSEVYEMENNEIVASPINLEMRGNNINSSFELFQNSPNPFNSNTMIGFTLPEASEVNFKVYDYNGTVLKEIKKFYDKGYNSIDLNVSELNKTGILFYQLDSRTHSAIKKMIVIK
jgi:hypothetical protein